MTPAGKSTLSLDAIQHGVNRRAHLLIQLRCSSIELCGVDGYFKFRTCSEERDTNGSINVCAHHEPSFHQGASTVRVFCGELLKLFSFLPDLRPTQLELLLSPLKPAQAPFGWCIHIYASRFGFHFLLEGLQPLDSRPHDGDLVRDLRDIDPVREHIHCSSGRGGTGI